MPHHENHAPRRSRAPIRWAVVPAAGRGRRIRTLAQGASKEMIPVGGRPLIDHTLSDLRAGGIEKVVVVANPEKEDLTSHLTRHWPRSFIEMVHQGKPLGVAHAVAQARSLVRDDPFVVFMPDNCPVSGPGLTRQLMTASTRRRGWILGLLRLGPERLGHFGRSGFVTWESVDSDTAEVSPRMVRITEVQDKGCPPPAPVAGSWLKGFPASIFTAAFFSRVESLVPSPRSGELEDTPILQALSREGLAIGAILEGVVCDCGIPGGLEEARRRLASCS